MPEITRLTGTADANAGFEVVTRSGSDEYHTFARYTGEDDDVVEITDRWKVCIVSGRTEDVEQKATSAIKDALEEIGVTVA